MAEQTSEYSTILGPDARFKGDLSFDGTAKILGKFEGQIKAKGKIFIADGSSCKATVSAKEVTIEGHVEGDVHASERVEMKPSGRITGDVVAARMTMADGASIDGHVRIGAGNQGAGAKSGSATEMKPTSTAQSVSPAHAGKSK